jgi:hypothetical protein
MMKYCEKKKKGKKRLKSQQVMWEVKARPILPHKARPILAHVSESVFSLPPYSPLHGP